MKLQVTETTKIKDLQKQFSEVYPFLKIEFYKSSHPEKIFCNDKLFADIILSEIARFLKPVSIHIDKHRTITEVEDEFYNKFGIALHVCGRSGKLLMGSSFSDNRTLEEQNEFGKRIY